MSLAGSFGAVPVTGVVPGVHTSVCRPVSCPKRMGATSLSTAGASLGSASSAPVVTPLAMAGGLHSDHLVLVLSLGALPCMPRTVPSSLVVGVSVGHVPV